MFIRKSFVILLVLVVSIQIIAAQIPPRSNLTSSVSRERLTEIDTVVESEITQKRLPGAVVLVARKGRTVWRKAYGARAVEPAREPMSVDLFEQQELRRRVIVS